PAVARCHAGPAQGARRHSLDRAHRADQVAGVNARALPGFRFAASPALLPWPKENLRALDSRSRPYENARGSCPNIATSSSPVTHLPSELKHAPIGGINFLGAARTAAVAAAKERQMAQMVADVLVAVLEQIGVRQIFGLIGDSLNPLGDAVR